MTVATGILFAEPYNRPISNTGQLQANCYRKFYLTGTTTLATVYQDGALTVPYSQNPTPITADGSGRFQPIYMNPTVVYRAQLFSASGTLLEDVDPYVLPLVQNVFNLHYQAPFLSGQIAYGGPNNSLQGNDNFTVGMNLPNPSGLNGAAFLLGSGGGNGSNVYPWIITDQAFDSVTPGNDFGIVAGETQGSGTARGGNLLTLGGGSFGGTGGTNTVQGGTSANAGGGAATLAGGNATGSTGAAIPGDAFVIGGQVGKQGANVHLIATLLNGIAGDVRLRINSTILMQFLQHGEIYLTLSGTGAGLAGQPLVSGGIGAAAKWQTGFTGTFATGDSRTATVASGIIISVA